MTPLTPTHSAQYCLLAALLLHALPHDGTYVAVAGLFLAMKVQPPASSLLTACSCIYPSRRWDPSSECLWIYSLHWKTR